jgi:hypothetical protein
MAHFLGIVWERMPAVVGGDFPRLKQQVTRAHSMNHQKHRGHNGITSIRVLQA